MNIVFSCKNNSCPTSPLCRSAIRHAVKRKKPAAIFSFEIAFTPLKTPAISKRFIGTRSENKPK
jgi:hypothetical protein